MFHWCHNV
jgi:hypothetical protein